jgi:hypothetical protein
MSAATTSFYQTGGNLPQNAPSCLERHADRDLDEGLKTAETDAQAGRPPPPSPAE